MATMMVHKARLSLAGGEHIFLWEKAMANAERLPVVVVVHGMSPMGALYYDMAIGTFSLVEYLARAGFRVLTFDLRGFGHSSRPAGGVNFQTHMVDLDAVLAYTREQHGAHQVSLVGGSYGALLGAVYTASHPERVREMVLLSMPYGEPPPDSTPLIRRFQELWARGVHYVDYPRAPWQDGRAVDPDPACIPWLEEAGQAYPWQVPTWPATTAASPEVQAAVRALRVPAHVVCGDRDFTTSLAGTLQLYHDLASPRKSLGLLANAGHSLHMERHHLAAWALVRAGLSWA